MTSYCTQPANQPGNLALGAYGFGLLSLKSSYRNLRTGVFFQQFLQHLTQCQAHGGMVKLTDNLLNSYCGQKINSGPCESFRHFIA